MGSLPLALPWPPNLVAQYYRRRAAEARQMAEKLPDNSVIKDAYLEAERDWLHLAERAERADDLVQQQQQQQQQGTESDESDEKD